jgi:hypothetical protein
LVPAVWLCACAVAIAAMFGLVAMPLGAAATVIAVGACFDPQLTPHGRFRRSLILFCGEVLSWWWPTPDVNGSGGATSMTSEGEPDGE